MDIEAKCTREEFEELRAQLEEKNIEYTAEIKKRMICTNGLYDGEYYTYTVWFFLNEKLI